MNSLSLSNTPAKDSRPINQRPRFDFLRVIAVLSSIAFAFIILIKFIKAGNSDIHEIIQGSHYIDRSGKLLFSTSNVHFDKNNYFLSIYVRIRPSEPIDSPTFSLSAQLTCQSKTKTSVVQENLSLFQSGDAELYTSWFPAYHSMAIELLVEGPVDKNTQITLMIVKTKKDFAEATKSISKLIVLGVICNVVIYIMHITVYKSRFGSLELCVVLLLFTQIAANIYYVKSNGKLKLSKHCISLLLRGISSAAEIVAVFVASLFFFSTENMATAMMIAFMFILSEAFCDLTTDNYVLSEIFDNNGLIWIFFFSSSIISKICLIILSIHHYVECVLNTTKTKTRAYFIIFLLVIVCLILPYLYKFFMMISAGYQSSATNYFCYYLSSYLIIIVFVQLCWPTSTKLHDPNRVEELMSMDSHQLSLERDMSVQFEQNVE